MLGTILRALLKRRVDQLLALWRHEVRRASVTLALALAVTLSVGAALQLAAAAVVLAFWETHRVLVTLLMSLAFVMASLLIALFLLGRARQS